MSVVDGPRWEGMKKFNMNELYKIAGNKTGGGDAGEAGAKDKEAEAKDAEGSGAEAKGDDVAKPAGK